MIGVCRQLIDKQFARDAILKGNYFYVERDPEILVRAVTQGLSAAYDNNMHPYTVKAYTNATEFVVMSLLEDWEQQESSTWLDERYTKIAITKQEKSK